MQVFKRVDVASATKISGVLAAVFGVLLGIGFAFAGGGLGSFGGLPGWLIGLIGWPIICGLIGAIAGAIYAALYNLVAGSVGGLEVALEQDHRWRPHSLSGRDQSAREECRCRFSPG